MTSIEKQIEEQIDNLMDDIADEIFQLSQEELVRGGSMNSGELLKSGNVNRKHLKKEIIYSANHASFIEFGTSPHRPPFEPILKWVQTKLGLSGQEARGVAWAIVNKIKEVGTDPQPFMRPAIEKFLAKYR